VKKMCPPNTCGPLRKVRGADQASTDAMVVMMVLCFSREHDPSKSDDVYAGAAGAVSLGPWR
jgi:hypothetical protein